MGWLDSSRCRTLTRWTAEWIGTSVFVALVALRLRRRPPHSLEPPGPEPASSAPPASPDGQRAIMASHGGRTDSAPARNALLAEPELSSPTMESAPLQSPTARTARHRRRPPSARDGVRRRRKAVALSATVAAALAYLVPNSVTPTTSATVGIASKYRPDQPLPHRPPHGPRARLERTRRCARERRGNHLSGRVGPSSRSPMPDRPFERPRTRNQRVRPVSSPSAAQVAKTVTVSSLS
jgi:hypothetical protein